MIRRASSELAKCLRKTSTEAIQLRNVRYISFTSGEHTSPLFLKWKLKDHRLHTCNSDEKIIDPNSKPARFAIFLPKKSDYQELLERRLNYSSSEALNIVNNINHITERDIDEFKNIVEILRENRIQGKHLVNNLFLFWQTSRDVEVNWKFIMSKLGISPEAALPLLEIMPQVNVYIQGNLKQDLEILKCCRVMYFHRKFSVEPQTISQWLKFYPHLLRVNAKRLVAATDLALGVTTAPNIMGDPQFYNYSPAIIQARITAVKTFGMTNIKPWILRAPLSRLENYHRQLNDNVLHALKYRGEHFVKELKEVLDCDEDVLREMLFRIQSKNSSLRFSKIKQVADLFRDLGYPTSLIPQQTTMLYFSYDELKSRLVALKERGITGDEIGFWVNFLTRSKKTFDREIKSKLW